MSRCVYELRSLPADAAYATKYRYICGADASLDDALMDDYDEAAVLSSSSFVRILAYTALADKF